MFTNSFNSNMTAFRGDYISSDVIAVRESNSIKSIKVASA
jgi:hypothetical protein